MITTPKTAAAAKHRFLHIPGREGLTRLPSSALSLLSSPYVASLLLPAVLGEPFRAREMTPHEIDAPADESVDAFLSRRFGAPFARVFGSALVHGIYAADARVLSVRAAFPALWAAAERGRGSVVRGMVFGSRAKTGEKGGGDAYDVGDVSSMMEGASVYSFRDGIETLPRAMRKWLDAAPNVHLRMGTDVKALRMSSDEDGAQVCD